MKHLPTSPDLDHLKRQAKQLLRAAKNGDPAALGRFAAALPSARGRSAEALASVPFKLHDAQSALAREYGYPSWTELKRAVAWKRATRAERLKSWLGWALEGNRAQLRAAVRALREEPDLFAGDAWLACVIGDGATLRAALDRDPGFANRSAGPLAMPPLAAVTHSRLILEEGFEAPLLACARLLIARGADVNGAWNDARFPDNPLSVLYGAAGRTHHAGMTKLLLDAGANPNDNESLYHAVESADPACLRLLLDAGAQVAGTNAVARALDYDKLDALRLLLAQHAGGGERFWLHHAVLRGRSLAHIRTLVEAGADLRATNEAGISVYAWASMHGRTDVLALLRAAGVEEELGEAERFVSACACGDAQAARGMLAQNPGLLGSLSRHHLQVMPQLAAIGGFAGVRTMLALGWPREVKAAWHATALNLAVFVGDAAIARLLLEHGADWRTKHGFDGTVLGTLSFASQADDVGDPAPRDYAGCAQALLDHGVPRDAFQPYAFSAEVAEHLASVARPD